MREIKGKNYNNNINFNSYQEKKYKYCWKCGNILSPPSITPFCCWECHQDYYKELAQDMDDIVGVN